MTSTLPGANRMDAPWEELEDRGTGYLSVYFSDPIARWPVRAITRPGDNKSDPNIETGTYGLFSTCEPPMRNRIVKDGAATIFFVTTHKPRAGRSLTGYYKIGWFTEGTQGASNSDYALAASSMRFIKPLPVLEVPAELREICASPFRQMRPTSVQHTSALVELIDQADDRTSDYLQEVERLETFALDQCGYAYPSWGRQSGFSWDEAPAFYKDGDVPRIPNSSRSNSWRCQECNYVVQNRALLKMCPICNHVGSLVPFVGVRP
ncbi:hypothetical protein [Aeromicrobium yanjiei]|uniref:Uncharacterized protein n=1 Tax=Aeromicrobium yanjiei TaxID=2662028 RepID=A0A5Q2MHS4_9ACTN|nr:hypothetical protein [Aeromicrobium yanjiei]QGG41311.1 hypothetical protein GEV26_07990 [Aeromicrobium yanjiei]